MVGSGEGTLTSGSGGLDSGEGVRLVVAGAGTEEGVVSHHASASLDDGSTGGTTVVVGRCTSVRGGTFRI
jgi:hypothetical protein